MSADELGVEARLFQDQGTQEAEPPITDDEGALAGDRGVLLEDLERGREGLGEGRGVVVDRVWHCEEVLLGEREHLGERARVLLDTEDRAAWAVSLVPAQTRRTRTAADVDAADDALSGERAIEGATDELVTGHAAEVEVTSAKREVRRANACSEHLDTRLPLL